MALSPFGDSLPLVVYATGTLLRVTPDSSVKDGTIAISWSGMRAANGFSDCERVLSYRYSANVLLNAEGCREVVQKWRRVVAPKL
jgi:hypothetical protein